MTLNRLTCIITRTYNLDLGSNLLLMLKFHICCKKKITIYPIIIMIVIFISWYYIFSIFSTVKAETIGLADTYNLPKTSTSKLISIQSKEVNFTQEDSNNSYSPLILYNTNIIDGNSNLRSNITIITNGDKIKEIIDKAQRILFL